MKWISPITIYYNEREKMQRFRSDRAAPGNGLTDRGVNGFAGNRTKKDRFQAVLLWIQVQIAPFLILIIGPASLRSPALPWVEYARGLPFWGKGCL